MTIQTPQDSVPELRTAFDRRGIRLPLSSILPLKAIRPSVKATIKYQQILASIEEVGLVEAPVVTRSAKQADQYFLVDGHLRFVAIRELGWTEVECLLTEHDDTYTYNKRVGRLSAIQDHKMIVRAMERGVSAERLAKSLGLSVETVRQRFRLLNGICEEAASLLADAPCPAKVFSILRQMKAVRQMEAAELMLGNKNYTMQFANAMLAATPPPLLAYEPKVAASPGTVESIGRMERELAALQMQTSAVEDSYGPDVLHLTIVKGHLGKWLGNASVVRWLARHRPEYLKEFQRISETTDVGSA
ncbi:plasmid partitioning protein RepB C-terminal domain-containing protein [Luteibacter sp. NPDC031894]|uniref:plasmid partitioning protein RepB C-terminal domain-containing protein n=1 Tax=Luteibacter sp. NPDC031894 TaxID=3390572 RepID=UPI003D08258F